MAEDRVAQAMGNYGDLPQDPFLPFVNVEGPSFLDDGACMCALRSSPADNNTAMWQCLGNQTTTVGPEPIANYNVGIYNVTVGKWFNPAQIASFTWDQLAANDALNPPDLSRPLVWDSTSNTWLGYDNSTGSNLTVYEQACSGINQTIYSTAMYRAVDYENNGPASIDYMPCWYPDKLAVSIQIQNLSTWQNGGCNDGFFCPNNTVNSLPQFCPPIEACQELRLLGQTCSFNGNYTGTGPFEPVVCQEGYYCPKGGKEKIQCPSGSYCQIGAATPTPCAVGSFCPAGSKYQKFLIPLAVLIVVDVLIVAGIIWHHVLKRKRQKGAAQAQAYKKGKPGRLRAVATGLVGYHALPDDGADTEMLAMNHSYVPGQDPWTGFYAAMELAHNQGKRVEHVEEAEITPQLRAFIETMRKATDAAHFGLSFQYENLKFHPKSAPRPILQNVTGSINRGSLAAVMGGSGAGKSTFVNVLMGKTNNTGGQVMVNHSPGKIARYKKLIGYVPQDDIVLPELTVFENIMHSARIRLPRTWSDSEIEEHVTAVIDCLELSHVRDSLVGSVGKPVISGGQRKRVSIGMELAAAPMAIFLDEPTSGLDATSASSIMGTLKALARLGISVIVIIHQPRLEIWEMLDDLILLGNGQIIYEGKQVDVQHFFEEIGFHFPEHCNTGDVVTDIITGKGGHYKKGGDISKDALIAHWASIPIHEKPTQTAADKHASLVSTAMISSTSMHELLRTRGAPRLKQVWLCLRRAMVQQYRQKANFWFEMGLAALAGFLLGLAMSANKGELFRGIYLEPYSILSSAINYTSAPQLALLVAIAIGLVAGAPGVRVFSEEMLLHKREAEAGHSRLAYFGAKMVSTIPRMVVGCLHFTTLIMLLAVPVIPWGIAFLGNLLYFYCIYGLASVVSMLVRREDAPLIATMVALIVGILSGASPALAKVKNWHMEWLWRASPGVWLAEMYFGQLVRPYAHLYLVDQAAQVTGFHLDWLWRNMLILFGIGTIYRLLAYVGLVLGQRLRRS